MCVSIFGSAPDSLHTGARPRYGAIAMWSGRGSSTSVACCGKRETECGAAEHFSRLPAPLVPRSEFWRDGGTVGQREFDSAGGSVGDTAISGVGEVEYVVGGESKG